ncbi:hypothetical protein, partial [Ottowia sp.]|uniref:hypothetical protein n=1 Tax=Ottowia sp. TaxID=1898956 RepID=UPI002BFE9B80
DAHAHLGRLHAAAAGGWRCWNDVVQGRVGKGGAIGNGKRHWFPQAGRLLPENRALHWHAGAQSVRMILVTIHATVR